MKRQPKDHNAVIRERQEKLAAAKARAKAAIKDSSGRNDKQNGRLLRASSVHSMAPAVRMGAFLELERLAKDPRKVQQWEREGQAHFQQPARSPHVVAGRDERPAGTEGEQAAA